MSWSRVDDAFARHPKVLRLVARYGVDGYVALGWWLLLLTSSRDGTLDPELAQLVAPGVDPQLVLPKLTEVGLVDELGDGRFAFHDWSHYQDRHGRERQAEAGRRRAAGPRDERGRLLPAHDQLSPGSAVRAGTSSRPARAQAGDQPGSSRPVPVPTPDGVRDGYTARAGTAAPSSPPPRAASTPAPTIEQLFDDEAYVPEAFAYPVDDDDESAYDAAWHATPAAGGRNGTEPTLTAPASSAAVLGRPGGSLTAALEAMAPEPGSFVAEVLERRRRAAGSP